MPNYTHSHGIEIDTDLFNFVNDEVLAGVGIDKDHFWSGFCNAVDELTPINTALLQKRQDLQKSISAWLKENQGKDIDLDAYRDFLKKIDYLVEEGDDFSITTTNCDPEITTIAGPQLVVPVLNARYALNAANARWRSLYDALYGTDVIANDGEAIIGDAYNPERGKVIIAMARKHLDKVCPLTNGSHKDAVKYAIDNGALEITLADGTTTGLIKSEQLRGYCGAMQTPTSILLCVNNLHIELIFKSDGLVAADDKAGINDILVESAISTIVDLEDSVAAVDAQDKIAGYRNWLGLMRGDLDAGFQKNGQTLHRRLNSDREYTALDGSSLTLHGRALLLLRNVGHLMTNPAMRDSQGNEIFEGIMDAFITTAIALYDLKGLGTFRNSRTGSVYIVKPKMHGPEEVAFADTLFARVETLFGLNAGTIKIGIMDEERRTSINLKECIRAAKSRVMFINTGFLDRTGDEIHTSMDAGAMIRKTEMKATKWITAYEIMNVDIGLACGFSGKAQIGKGMWAMPDLMAAMLKEKIAHPQAGANTAWVPSPTAASLHALHYHEIDVAAVQTSLKGKARATFDDLITIPVDPGKNLSDADIQAELNNNAQGILGYVVKWIDQGIGCSKVPDINNIGLMEDRATLRISSQHIANWLHHGIVNKEQVMQTMQAMAGVVDAQNKDDSAYTPMAGNFDTSIAFKAACDLVFEGINQPSGYTEPILHQRRLEAKASSF